MWFKHAFAIALVCGLAVACSDVAPPASQDAGPDGIVLQPDGRIDVVQPEPDTLQSDSAADQAVDSVQSNSALQVVIDDLTLPARASDYAKDLDGDNVPDNQLGALMGILAIANFDAQGELDATLEQGGVLLLLDLLADSLSDVLSAELNAYVGVDLDDPEDPSDNFSGSEPFAVDPTAPEMLLPGSILAGRLNAGPGNFLIPLPMLGTVSIQQTQLSADVSATGMQNGQINGAIPWTEMETVVLPSMAQMLTELIQDPTADPTLVSTVTSFFDTNRDGTISVAELQGNLLLSAVLKADVDLDGDGTNDAMSLGLGFTAVPAVIQF